MCAEAAASETKTWLGAQAIILLSWLPVLVALLLSNGHNPARDFSWIPPATAAHLWRVFSAVYLFRISDVSTFELLPARVPGLGLAIIALAALALAALYNLAPYYSAETKPRWDLAAAYLGQRLGPDDVVVINGPMPQYVLTKYAGRYNLDRMKILGRPGPSEVRAARIWVVTGRTGQGSTPDEFAFDADWLAARTPSLSIRLGKHVTLQLFEHMMQPSAVEQRRSIPPPAPG